MVIHRKDADDSKQRQAIADVLDFAQAFCAEVQAVAGFNPMADMRGFKGAAEALDTTTSKWLLRGLGFDVQR